MQMKRFVQVGAAALAVAAFTLVSGTQAEAGKCKKYSARAIGVPDDVAKGLAKVALDVEIGFAGAKAKGKTSYKCSAPCWPNARRPSSPASKQAPGAVAPDLHRPPEHMPGGHFL